MIEKIRNLEKGRGEMVGGLKAKEQGTGSRWKTSVKKNSGKTMNSNKDDLTGGHQDNQGVRE